MSGGVGPCSDISLPKEENHEPAEKDLKAFSKKEQQQHQQRGVGGPQRRRGGRKSFFTFRQMNALAVIIVLSASGMVSIEDFAFVVFSLAYIYFISKIAFPSLFHYSEPQVFDQNNKILRLYQFIGAVTGLFLPIAYIFEGIFEGDKEGIKAATPHVFLLASQVFMEGVAFAGGFSLPIQVFVPIVYNTMRLFRLVEWLRNEIYKVDLEYSGSARRLRIGRALAVVNMAFWCFNLFGFLLPIYLPKAFKMYYSGYKGKM